VNDESRRRFPDGAAHHFFLSLNISLGFALTFRLLVSLHPYHEENPLLRKEKQKTGVSFWLCDNNAPSLRRRGVKE